MVFWMLLFTKDEASLYQQIPEHGGDDTAQKHGHEEVIYEAQHAKYGLGEDVEGHENVEYDRGQ